MRLDLPTLPSIDPALALVALGVVAGLALLLALARAGWRRRSTSRADRERARTLQRRIRAAHRAALRTLHAPRGGPSWWLVLGPTGHGKSALLSAAPRAVEVACGAPGEPRFFLTATGVFVELPPGDPPLPLLRALRRRARPVAGVLVVVRADAGPDALAATRAQLDAWCDALALRVPVALVVAQLDRLAGFADLTDDLTSRTSVLGVTLPPRAGAEPVRTAARLRLAADDGPLAWVRQRCHALVARARTDDERSARLHGFWRLFAGLTDRAADLAAALAGPADAPPRLRAIYFTSAAVGGPPPVDAWLAELAVRVGAAPSAQHVAFDEPASPVDAPSFVGDLFAVELPRDSRYATRSPAHFRRRARVATLAAAAALLAAAALAVTFTHAAQTDRALLRTTWSGVRGATAPSSALHPPLADIAALGDAVVAWQTDRGLTLVPGDALAGPAAAALRGAVCRGVLRPVAARAERALRDFTSRHAGAGLPSDDAWTRAHDRLRLYLLLSLPAASDEPAPWDTSQSPWLIEHVSKFWSLADGDDDDPRRAAVLARHAELVRAASLTPPAPLTPTTDPCAATGDARPLARDPALVAAARAVLHRRPGERVALARILEQIDRRPDLRPIDRAALTQSSALLGDIAVRPAFTRDGWEAFRDALRAELRARSDHAWVLGRGAAELPAAHRCERLRGLYVARHEQAWRDFLAALRLRAPSSLPEAATLLQEIVEQAPLAAILRAVDEHTQRLTPLGCPADDRLVDLLARTVQPARAGAADAPELAAAFARLVGFAVAPPRSPAPAPLARYHERLADVRGAVQAALDDHAQLPALQASLTQARRGVDDLVRRGALGTWADPLARLLAPPLDGLELLVNDTAGRDLGAEWCAAIVRPLEQTIAGRYPFDPDARIDARIDDLTRLFHPRAGEIARFRDARLGGFVAVGGNDVRPRELGSAASLRLQPQVLELLHAAHQLGVLLFPDDAPALAAELTLACDPAVNRVTLSIDGVDHTYLCSIDHSKQITWPGDQEPRGAALIAHGPGGRRGELPAAGDFGLFRLFERNHPRGKVGAFSLEFDLTRHGLGALRVTVRPRPVRGGDPFHGFADGPFLAPFRVHALTHPPHALFTGLAHACPAP